MTDPAPHDAASQPKFTEEFENRNNFDPEHQDADENAGPKRHSTLKKKKSLSRAASKRSHSRAGSVRSTGLGSGDLENRNSVFYTPIPTKGNPTEVLVNRFTAWRRVLKDFISYFKDVQAQYEARSRGITKVTHSLNAAATPTGPSEFCATGGILETNNVLRDFHKEAFSNNESAAKIETDVIANLVTLRSDLKAKISEIKGLSGDFKNNVEKEKEATKKEVARLQEALSTVDSNPAKDPYLSRLAVEKQLRKYLHEENYLHRAYLNIESSGRELEKIVVGEIQKAYGAYVKILAREGQELLDMADRLTTTTMRLPQDYEWNAFLERDSNLVDPSVQLRSFEHIEYPGYQHPAVTEVRSGQLERKSKYLKSFTGGWYSLSPTHLHEFKTADRTRDQTPVMSLYLPDSTLGKHSDPHATSHKFIIKGRQTGAMHRDHSWVFRAESHAAMLEWYEAIKKLTEVSGAERNAYVESTTAHKRQPSTASRPDTEKAESYSETDFENDEADAIPYSTQASIHDNEILEPPKRPEAGRFPSDIAVHRNGLERRVSSGNSSASAVAAASALPGTSYPGYGYGTEPQPDPQTFGGSAYDENAHKQPVYDDTTQHQHPLDSSYVVVPHVDRTGADTPSSWSYNGETRTPLDTTITADGVEAVDRSESVPIAYSPSRDAIQHDFADFDSERVEPARQQDRHVVFGVPKNTEDYYSREADATQADYDNVTTPLATQPLTGISVDTPGEASNTGTTAVPVMLGGSAVIPQTTTTDAAAAAVPPQGMEQMDSLERPSSVRGNSMNTLNTISDLHVPGEYPKRTAAGHSTT
ncbi:hypothetical protein EDC01DRAFT_639283 [Geopyxis carbonaria]|nr:hypothetical protein EDC01DRAFT_639283 [Geopyxis carbonaria]